MYGLASFFTTFRGVQQTWKTIIRNDLEKKILRHPKVTVTRPQLNCHVFHFTLSGKQATFLSNGTVS